MIMAMSYKLPKLVINCEFIMTTQLLFAISKLKIISQSDFLESEQVIYRDSTTNQLKI